MLNTRTVYLTKTKRLYVLALATFFFLSVISQCLGLQYSQGIQSYGTVSYRLMGANISYRVATASILDIARDAGAKCIRHHGLSKYVNDPTWKQSMSTVRTLCTERGIKLRYASIGQDSWDTGLVGSSWAQWKADVFMNTNGLGDQWINDHAQIISWLKPDLIDVMNEPMDLVGTTWEGEDDLVFQNYLAFVLRAIDAWRAVKPDLVCVVAGFPYWDMMRMALNPIPRSNILYDYHVYYSYTGAAPSEPWQLAYWEGRLEDAKKLLYEDILLRGNLQDMIKANLPLTLGEVGCHIQNPNADIYMRDIFDFCKQYNMGMLWHALSAYPPENSGLLASDWSSLNTLGQVWARNMLGVS